MSTVGSTLRHDAHRPDDPRLAHEVEVRGRLVEEEDRGIDEVRLARQIN